MFEFHQCYQPCFLQALPSKKRRVQTTLGNSEDESTSDPFEATRGTAEENIDPDAKRSLENIEKCCSDTGGKANIKSGQIK